MPIGCNLVDLGHLSSRTSFHFWLLILPPFFDCLVNEEDNKDENDDEEECGCEAEGVGEGDAEVDDCEGIGGCGYDWGVVVAVGVLAVLYQPWPTLVYETTLDQRFVGDLQNQESFKGDCSLVEEGCHHYEYPEEDYGDQVEVWYDLEGGFLGRVDEGCQQFVRGGHKGGADDGGVEEIRGRGGTAWGGKLKGDGRQFNGGSVVKINSECGCIRAVGGHLVTDGSSLHHSDPPAILKADSCLSF